MELLRLLARQRLLKVGEKGIMTIGTKEAVEREANNLALLLKKYKLDPSAFNDIGSLRRTIRGLEELDIANVLKAKAPPPDNVIEGKFGKSFSEEIKDMEKGKVKLFGDESQVELAYISKFNKHPRDVIVPNLPKRPANYNELSLDDRRMIDLEAENIYKEELKESIFLEDSMKKNIAEATKKGDFTGIANQVLRDPDIMREFMLSKKFPFSPDKNVLSGEDAIPLARAAKFDEEMTGLGVSATPGKDAKNTVDEFVNQMKRFKVSDKDIQSMLKSGKSGQVDYVMEQYGLSASDVADILKRGKPLIEGMASGGRAELKGGGDALKALIRFLSAQSGKTGSQGLQDINPKKFGEAFNFMIGKEQMATLQKYRKEYLESLLDTIKSDKKLLDDIKTKYPEDIKPIIYKMANEGGNKGRLDVYNKIDINEAITDIETMVKNMELAGGRKLNSDGGRVGLKVGSMSKRAFLKMLAALGITGAAAKSGILSLGGKQSGKQVVKEVIKTSSAKGKPEWFDQLINKVVLEGDDVTKNFATKERQIVHTKKIDEDNTVRVTQDLDEGSITVEYDSPNNVFEDTVQLKYKKPPPDEGDPRPSAEFNVAESGPVGRRYGPDDFEIEIDEVGGTSINDLDSDVSKLKEFATGKKPTIKEIVKNKKRKDKAQRITEDQEAQMDVLIKKQGEMSGEEYDYASGGIARMLGE